MARTHSHDGAQATVPPDIVAILAARARRFGRWPALRQVRGNGDGLSELSWAEWFERAQVLANALRAYGVHPGARVALLARSCPDWLVADMAVLMAGGVSVPLPRGATPAAYARMVLETRPRVVVAGTADDWKQLSRHRPQLAREAQLVLLEAGDAAAIAAQGDFAHRPVSIEDALVRGRAILERGDGIRPRSSGRPPDAPATILYSAGRTGPARGSVISHGAVVSKVLALREVLVLPRTAVQLLVLPLCTQFGRLMAWSAVDQGATTCLHAGRAADSEALAAAFAQARPHFFAGTPAIFEALAAYLTRDRPGAVGLPGRATLALSRPLWEGNARDRKWLLGADRRLATRLLRTRVRYLLGGRIQHLVCGGGDLPRRVAQLFTMAGLPILEGYGSNESVGAATANRPGSVRPGSVGQPLSDVDLSLSPSGEIWIQGPGLFSGYLVPPYEDGALHVDAARDSEGWFHTRDLGLLEEGYLYLTGRREDLLRLSSGRLVAPAPIEALLAADDRVAHALVCGEGRPHLGALLWPADGVSLDARAARSIVDRVNRDLARHEQIRAVAVVTAPLRREAGDLSMHGDPVRHVAYERLRDTIQSLYDGR